MILQCNNLHYKEHNSYGDNEPWQKAICEALGVPYFCSHHSTLLLLLQFESAVELLILNAYQRECINFHLFFCQNIMVYALLQLYG